MLSLGMGWPSFLLNRCSLLEVDGTNRNEACSYKPCFYGSVVSALSIQLQYILSKGQQQELLLEIAYGIVVAKDSMKMLHNVAQWLCQ
jgi:hypothetical protein